MKISAEESTALKKSFLGAKDIVFSASTTETFVVGGLLVSLSLQP